MLEVFYWVSLLLLQSCRKFTGTLAVLPLASNTVAILSHVSYFRMIASWNLLSSVFAYVVKGGLEERWFSLKYLTRSPFFMKLRPRPIQGLALGMYYTWSCCSRQSNRFVSNYQRWWLRQPYRHSPGVQPACCSYHGQENRPGTLAPVAWLNGLVEWCCRGRNPRNNPCMDPSDRWADGRGN